MLVDKEKVNSGVNSWMEWWCGLLAWSWWWRCLLCLTINRSFFVFFSAIPDRGILLPSFHYYLSDKSCPLPNFDFFFKRYILVKYKTGPNLNNTSEDMDVYVMCKYCVNMDEFINLNLNYRVFTTNSIQCKWWVT